MFISLGINHKTANVPATPKAQESFYAQIKARKIEGGTNIMASVFDVAVYILEQHSPIATMKLQKLVYYCQAWSLVWDEEPLFPELIEAWANGPVVLELYQAHRGRFKISPDDINGNSSNLTTIQKETVDAIIRDYGSKSSQWLSNLTHFERPWLDARKGLAPGNRGNREISLASMAEYYEAVASDGIGLDLEFD